MYQVKIINLNNNEELICYTGEAVMCIVVKQHATPQETMHGSLTVIGKISPKDAMIANEKLREYTIDKIITAANGDSGGEENVQE